MTSEKFKAAISEPDREFKSKIELPGLILDDETISNIDIDSSLVFSEDFEIGTAPMDTSKIELIVDENEWGRNLLRGTTNERTTLNHTGYNFYIHEVVDSKVEEIISNKGTYTASIYIENTEYAEDCGLMISFRNRTTGLKTQHTSTQRAITGFRGRLTFTFEIPDITYDEGDYIEVHLRNVKTDYTFKGAVGDVKLEKGPATPWKPAPEDILDYNYEDKESNIKLGIMLEDESAEYVDMGIYTIEKAVKKDNKITLDMVDRMYKAEKEFQNNLMFPTTVFDILQSACEQSGIELATLSFANADYVVPNEPVFEDITCRTIFAQVAELAGGYAKINRQGQLEILALSNDASRDITKDHYFELNTDEVAIGKVDKVIVKVGDEVAESGTGENIYTIVDNMFVQNPNDVVDNIYNVLKSVDYIACEFKWQGDFSLDLGDKIVIDGNETYILDRKLKYAGGLTEDYKSPAKSNVEKESTGKGSLTLALENVKTQIKVMDGEITQTIEKIEGEVRNEVAEQLRDAEIYTWIKYADDEHGNGISDNPTGKKYVGIATNKKNIEPSNNPADYEWSRVQGEQGPPGQDGKDGQQGIQGPKGADGQSQWTHIRYSVNANGNPMTTSPSSATKYIGIAITTSSTAPTGYASYVWQKFVGEDGQQGIPGQKGADGVTYYTWIKYATTPTTGMSDSPSGKPYIGIAHNKTTATESTNYSDYTWSLIKGEQGQKGADGVTYYTWIKYADDKFGNGMSDSSDDKRYVGIATNKTTPNKSTNPSDYEWSPLYDNVEIGGENRLFDSKTNIEFYSNDNLDIHLIRGPGKPYYKVYNSHGNSINLFAAFPNSRFAEPLESLGRVTVSLEVLVDVDRDVTINGATFPVKGNRWTKIYFSKEFGENITKHIRVRNPFSRKRTKDINVGTRLIDSLTTNINTLYYRNLQVERGNVPTDHNLTPEELEDGITTTRTELRQLADSILLIAQRNENTGRLEVTPEAIVQAIEMTDGVGKLKTVKVTIDKDGLTVDDGAIIIRDSQNTAIITSDGLKIIFNYTSSGNLNGFQEIGIWDNTMSIYKREAFFAVSIPDKLAITRAMLTVVSMPSYFTGWANIPNGFYHARNLRLYHDSSLGDGYIDYPYQSDYTVIQASKGSDITGSVWGSSWSPSGNGPITKVADVTSYLDSGSHVFSVATTDNTTVSNSRYMGGLQFNLVVEGYLRG